MKKFFLSYSIYQELIHHMIFIYAFMVQMIIYPEFFIIIIIIIFLSKFWFSWFLGGGESKGQKIVHKKSCPLHLKSKEPYIIWCHLWYTSVTWWYLQAFFFKILIFQKKGKKWSKMRKDFACWTPYIRNSTSYDWHSW